MLLQYPGTAFRLWSLVGQPVSKPVVLYDQLYMWMQQYHNSCQNPNACCMFQVVFIYKRMKLDIDLLKLGIARLRPCTPPFASVSSNECVPRSDAYRDRLSTDCTKTTIRWCVQSCLFKTTIGWCVQSCLFKTTIDWCVQSCLFKTTIGWCVESCLFKTTIGWCVCNHVSLKFEFVLKVLFFILNLHLRVAVETWHRPHQVPHCMPLTFVFSWCDQADDKL